VWRRSEIIQWDSVSTFTELPVNTAKSENMLEHMHGIGSTPITNYYNILKLT